MKTKDHKSKKVNISGNIVNIDTDIADLIVRLNKSGIKTFSCCQGSCMGHCNVQHKTKRIYSHGKYVWKSFKSKKCKNSVCIAFPSMKDGDRFMEKVYRESDSDRMKDHIQGYGSRRSLSWSWNLTAENGQFWMTVVFPRQYLSLVESRI